MHKLYAVHCVRRDIGSNSFQEEGATSLAPVLQQLTGLYKL
jgi:hypothetical protein